jgi:hypothetical protein
VVSPHPRGNVFVTAPVRKADLSKNDYFTMWGSILYSLCGIAGSHESLHIASSSPSRDSSRGVGSHLDNSPICVKAQAAECPRSATPQSDAEKALNRAGATMNQCGQIDLNWGTVRGVPDWERTIETAITCSHRALLA